MTKIWKRIYYFYTAPVMRFSHTMVLLSCVLIYFLWVLHSFNLWWDIVQVYISILQGSYVVFLAFFSYALLTGFGDEVTWVEILMYVWVFFLMLEEVREVTSTNSLYTCSILTRPLAASVALFKITQTQEFLYFLWMIVNKWGFWIPNTPNLCLDSGD